MNEFRSKYSSKYSSESIRRKTVGLTIKPDLLAKAREMNLNLSKLLENTLLQLIEPQNTPFSLSEGSLYAKRESSMVARGRFELPSTGPKPAMLVHYTRQRISLIYRASTAYRAARASNVFLEINFGNTSS